VIIWLTKTASALQFTLRVDHGRYLVHAMGPLVGRRAATGKDRLHIRPTIPDQPCYQFCRSPGFRTTPQSCPGTGGGCFPSLPQYCRKSFLQPPSPTGGRSCILSFDRSPPSSTSAKCTE
jgi:hypothetical protein